MAYFSYFRAASFVPRIWLLELIFKFWQPLFCSLFKNGRAISYVVIHLLSRHFYRVDRYLGEANVAKEFLLEGL